VIIAKKVNSNDYAIQSQLMWTIWKI